MTRVGNVASGHLVHSDFSGRAGYLCQGPLAQGATGRSAGRQLRALPLLGTLVRGRAAGFHRHELSSGRMDPATTFRNRAVNWHFAELAAVERVQIPAGNRDHASIFFTAKVRTSRVAFGNL